MGALLKGATVGKASVLFDRKAELDLGGVHARLFYFGAAHTRGDEIIDVPEDSLILPGDVGEEHDFLVDLQQRAMALKQQGIPADEAGKILEREFKSSYADWSGLGNIP